MALTSQDFLKGLDFTGINPATGADHNNLIELAAPASDSASEGKGIVVWTVDSALDTPVVPNAVSVTKWKRYIWLRIPHATATVNTPLIYGWNDAAVSHATYLKWVQSTVDLTDVLADIAALEADTAQLTGDIANANTLASTANTTANTALTNAANALGTANGAAANALTAIGLGNQGITDAAAAQATANTAVTNAAAAQATANSALTRANASGLLQSVMKGVVGGDNTVTVIPFDNTIPQNTEGKEYVSQVFTPTSATSLIRVRFSAMLHGNPAGYVTMALFKSGSADALISAGCDADGDQLSVVTLEHVIASPAAGAPITFSIRFGPSAGITAYINSINTGGVYGNAARSYLQIDEVVGQLN